MNKVQWFTVAFFIVLFFTMGVAAGNTALSFPGDQPVRHAGSLPDSTIYYQVLSVNPILSATGADSVLVVLMHNNRVRAYKVGSYSVDDSKVCMGCSGREWGYYGHVGPFLAEAYYRLTVRKSGLVFAGSDTD